MLQAHQDAVHCANMQWCAVACCGMLCQCNVLFCNFVTPNVLCCAVSAILMCQCAVMCHAVLMCCPEMRRAHVMNQCASLKPDALMCCAESILCATAPKCAMSRHCNVLCHYVVSMCCVKIL